MVYSYIEYIDATDGETVQVLLLLFYMVYSYIEYIDAKDGETVQVLLLLLYSSIQLR